MHPNHNINGIPIHYRSKLFRKNTPYRGKSCRKLKLKNRSDNDQTNVTVILIITPHARK